MGQRWLNRKSKASISVYFLIKKSVSLFIELSFGQKPMYLWKKLLYVIMLRLFSHSEVVEKVVMVNIVHIAFCPFLTSKQQFSTDQFPFLVYCSSTLIQECNIPNYDKSWKWSKELSFLYFKNERLKIDKVYLLYDIKNHVSRNNINSKNNINTLYTTEIFLSIKKDNDY